MTFFNEVPSTAKLLGWSDVYIPRCEQNDGTLTRVTGLACSSVDSIHSYLCAIDIINKACKFGGLCAKSSLHKIISHDVYDWEETFRHIKPLHFGGTGWFTQLSV